MSINSDHGEVSMTYGDLYQKHPILADCIDSHEWDNMNISEQRNWALSQADGHKSERFKDALDASKTVVIWTQRALAAEMKLNRVQLVATRSEVIARLYDAKGLYFEGKGRTDAEAIGALVCHTLEQFNAKFDIRVEFDEVTS